MTPKLMVLPSQSFERIRVVQIPQDLELHEAYRFSTGIIAEAEETGQTQDWETLSDALEEHGFITLEHILGPSVD